MEWFFLKMLLITPDLMADMTRVKNKASYDPREYNEYRRRYPECMNMFDFLKEKIDKGEMKEDSGNYIKFNRGFGQGLLSVTSSLFCTFMLRFILLTMSRENEVLDFDFAQTSDDVLLYAETELTHEVLIDRLAWFLSKFGLQLSKPKCLEAYYDH